MSFTELPDLRERLIEVFHDAPTNSCATTADFRLLADAVIQKLAADCIYRYSCAHCGDFWFDRSERMQRFALLHNRSHLDTEERQ